MEKGFLRGDFLRFGGKRMREEGVALKIPQIPWGMINEWKGVDGETGPLVHASR